MNNLRQTLIQNVIEEFYFGEKLANYYQDCIDKKQYIFEKELPLFQFSVPKFHQSAKLNKKLISSLHLPPFKPLYKINSKIYDIQKKYKHNSQRTI